MGKLSVLLDEMPEVSQTDKICMLSIATVETFATPEAVGKAGEIGAYQVHPVHNPVPGQNNFDLAYGLWNAARKASKFGILAASAYNRGSLVPSSKLELKHVQYGLLFSVAMARLYEKANVSNRPDLNKLRDYDPALDSGLEATFSKIRGCTDSKIPYTASLVPGAGSDYYLSIYPRESRLEQWIKLWDDCQATPQDAVIYTELQFLGD